MAVSITRATLAVNKFKKAMSFGVIFALIFLVTPVLVFARAVQYAPGETLNPDCPPGESNCNVAQLSVNTTLNTFGIGTTSPYAKLSVVGEVVATYFSATSTTATSTFAGGLWVGGGALSYDFSSGITSIDDLQTGPMTFDTNAGILSWIDLPVTSDATAGTVESYSARIDGNSILTVYGESNGSGGIQNTAVGIGTTSPFAKLSVMGNAFFAGTMTASTINATSTTATSTFANGIALSGGCFSIAGTCITGGGGGGSGTVGSGTQGQFPFYNAAGTTLTATSTLFVSQAGNVGIGTASPAYKLDVNGTSHLNGNIQIGVNAGIILDADVSNGTGIFTTANGTINMKFCQGCGGSFSIGPVGATTIQVAQSGLVGIGTTTPGSQLSVTSGLSVGVNYGVAAPSNGVIIEGNLGIGTTSPGQKLSVAGDILGNAFIGSYFTVTSTETTSTFPYASSTALTATNLFATDFTLGTLTGPLQAIDGVTSATSTLSIVYGGTGLSDIPNYGQLLLGDNTGAYALTATSSLGLLGLATVSSLTTNYITKWDGTDFDDSVLFDNGTAVGIGTASPAQTLEVAGIALVQDYVTSSYFTATSTETASTFPYASTTALSIANLTSGRVPYLTTGGLFTDSSELAFDGTKLISTYASTTAISSSESAYFATDGGVHSVGIGTTSPWRTLSVDGTVAMNNLTVDPSAGSDAICLDPVTKEVYVNSGNVSCSLSSARFKYDIQSLENGLSIVKRLRPVSFVLNANNEAHLGFIAEEVAEVESRLIFTERGSTTPRGVRYEEITAVLAKAIQEQQAQIDTLRTQAGLSVGATLATSVFEAFQSFGITISETVARFRDVFVKTLHIEDRLCVDDVCLGKEELKTLLRNAGATTASTSESTSTTDTSSLDSSDSNTTATSTDDVSGTVDEATAPADGGSAAGSSESTTDALVTESSSMETTSGGGDSGVSSAEDVSPTPLE